MSISERIKKLVEKEGSKSKFSEKTGINYNSLNRVISKDTGVRSDTLLNIANAYPNLNLRWLIVGEDPMWLIEGERPGNGKKEDPEDGMLKERIIQLLEDKVKLLEQQLKQDKPGVAKELGIK